LNILLVDDSDDMRHLVELFLKMLSHDVDTATDGSEAVTQFQQKVYDVVFMDVRMPIMDGYEATLAIRAWEKENSRSTTPIVALTAFSTQEEISKSMDAGCTCHLVKPVNKDSLERVLAEMGEYCKSASEEGASGAESRAGSGPIQVVIDEDLKDLIPHYLDKRKQDIEKIKAGLETSDFEELRSIGHKVKGSGGGYGFDGLSEIGADLEMAARGDDVSGIKSQLAKLEDYLERVEITFEEV
jgi:CheY-like chemotaxis protein